MRRSGWDSWVRRGFAGLVGCAAVGSADAGGLHTFYGVGVGAGLMNMTGRFIATRRVPFLQLGWDGTSDYSFVVLQSGFATDNSMSYLNTVFGFGLPWIKIGSGFWRVTGTTPTQGGVDLGPGVGVTALTDASQRTKITNEAVPLYVRITPWRDHDNILNIDAWRSLHNRGRETIPVRILGGPADFVSQWDNEGQIQGFSIRYTHRITTHAGLNVDYLYMEGRNSHGTLPAAFGPSVQAPVVQWQTRALIVSAQIVF